MIDSDADIKLLSKELRELINARLDQLIVSAGSNDNLTAAIRYALMAPGKRLRPLICMLSTQCLGGNIDHALDPACAIEMIHTASLIVDDLPCMDDAELRRGQLACHRRYGESTAILGALELLSLGYKIMAEAPGLDNTHRVRLVQILASAVGINGLIGGQERDLAAEKSGDVEAADSRQVLRIHELKTGAMFIAAAESGGIVAGLDGDQLLPIREFAGQVGLAYQTLDDLLDVHGTAAVAGKDVSQDVDKPTLVGVLGSAGAADYANSMIAGAMASLQPLGPEMRPLESLVQNFIGKAVAGRVPNSRTIN